LFSHNTVVNVEYEEEEEEEEEEEQLRWNELSKTGHQW